MGVTGAGGGRWARALRLALLFVLALAAVEFLFGSILDASPLKTYLYTPENNSIITRNEYSSRWPNQVSFITKETPSQEPIVIRNSTQNSSAIISSKDIRNNTNISSVDYNNNSKENLENMTRISNPAIFSNVTSTPLLISKILDSIKYNGTEDFEYKISVTPEQKKLCPQTPPDLGPIEVNKTEIELESVENNFPAIHWGGRYSPPHCKSRHRVAIIVPYRDRQQHLAIFLNHMHPFLMKQQIEYGIFIIEQSGASDFNRAKLMNVGFIESQKLKADGWQCFIFHDIDLLPLDGRNMYTCPRQPRHMSASIDKLNFRLPYEDIFGGVSAMTKAQFTKVNGFSNKYWGWGGEDDDMFYRLKKRNYHIARYKMSVARYAMLDHKKSSPNPKRYQLLSQTGKTFQKDGLTTLEYELVEVTQHHLYTHMLVNIDERS